MKTALLGTIVLLSATIAAQADFSYTTTSKTTGGSMSGLAGNNNAMEKVYFKGQRLKSEGADLATIVDLGAQTITTIDNRTKTYTVKSLSDVAPSAGGAQVSIDVKETGQTRTINGHNAKELVMTMEMTLPQAPQMGKMQMEMDLWLSSDVPGIGEEKEFYRKNMDKFPWAAMAGGNPQMAQAMGQMVRKMAEMGGVRVESVMKMKSAGGAGAPAMPQMTAAQQAQMQAAMERMKQLQQQGGPGADAVAAAMARMGRGPAAPGGSGSLIEVTTDSTDFSTAAIPDSVFAIPAGYQKN